MHLSLIKLLYMSLGSGSSAGLDVPLLAVPRPADVWDHSGRRQHHSDMPDESMEIHKQMWFCNACPAQHMLGGRYSIADKFQWSLSRIDLLSRVDVYDFL